MAKQSLERRSFIKLFGAGLGAALFSVPEWVNATDLPGSRSHLDFFLQSPEWILHEDGTFDIIAGNIKLLRCRPSIDGQSIFASNTFMGDSPKGKRIIYELDSGFIMLDLKVHNNCVSIGAEISGMKRAPYWFSPIGEGMITGADHFFRQGIGTGGHTGVFSFPKTSDKKWETYLGEQAWSYDSYLTCGLIAPNGDTMVIGAYDHADFIQRSSLFNRPHRRGLYDRKAGDEMIFYEAGFATETIPLKDDFLKLPDLFVFYGTQPYGSLQQLAWNISRQNQARCDTNTNYQWSLKKEKIENFSLAEATTRMKLLDKLNPKLPLQTVMIGKGYCPVGDWLDPYDEWSKTLDDPARLIFSRGFRAGIWVAPFAVHEKSRVFRNHHNWILKDKDGFPIVQDEDSEGKIFVLDGSNNDVKAHLKKVFRTLRKIGFTYYQLDNLDYGLNDPNTVAYDREGRTSVQVFREIIQIIREEIGAGSFITASNTPYAPLIGLVDAVRISAQQPREWGTIDFENWQRELYNCQYFNNIFWQNDPGELPIANNTSQYSPGERKSLALWASMLGGAVVTSDDLSNLEGEELALWRFLQPSKRPQSAIIPYWGLDKKCQVALRQYKDQDGWGILICNMTEELVYESYLVSELIGEDDCWVFYWEPGFSMGMGRQSRISISLEKHECKLLFLSRRRENPPLDLTLGSRKMEEES